MSKIMAWGACPLPIDNTQKLYGLGHRTWHFVQPLLEEGHEILLVAVHIPGDNDKPPFEKITKDKWTYYQVNHPDLFHDLAFHQKLYDEFQPDALLGINTYPASFAARITSDKPFWADLNGALMTEAQAKAHKVNSNQPVTEFWEQELATISRADIFSTVSIPQKYMLLGELATIGRLNKATVDYEFAHWVPNSIENKETIRPDVPSFREGWAKPEDLIILWSGGYNTWTDIDTLFAGLTKAMALHPGIKFLSTGGSLPGHDETTYQRFQEMIQASPYQDRFRLLGWIPTEEVPATWFDCDLGINIDHINYETLTGARNRLIHMMKAGLPVLTTLGTEISQIIKDNQIGWTFQAGNSDDLKEKILAAAQNKENLKETGLKGKEYVYSHFTYQTTTGKLREWMKNPLPCPHRFQAEPSNIRPETGNTPHGSGKPLHDMINYFKAKYGKVKA
jgi:glycosyltransferase involved in cell wall biosynthesis